MLGLDNQTELKPPAWEELKLCARLPVDVHEYVARQGPVPAKADSRRQYNRLYLRTQGVMRYEGEYYGVYMADVSRTGVGFFSPVQLLPGSDITLWLAGDKVLHLKCTTCARNANNCYRCGAEYTARPGLASADGGDA